MISMRFYPSIQQVIGLLTLSVGFVFTAMGPTATCSGKSTDRKTLPGSVDLRPIFEKWKLERRIQGKRGTCSVFAVAVALEYALAQKQGKATRLSVEYLNWASNQVLREMRDGSFFSDLWKGYARYGVCPEEDMPYRNKYNPKLQPDKTARESARKMLVLKFQHHWIKRWNPKTGLTEPQLLEIKRVLSRKWPVCGGFRWPKAPVRWKNNILETPPPSGVIDGHSVLIVGYRDDPAQPGGGLFIFRNTNHNGRDGYMTYEYAQAYMNDAIWIDYKREKPGHRTTAGP